MTIRRLASFAFLVSLFCCNKGQAADNLYTLYKASQLMEKGDYKTAAEALRMDLYKDDKAPTTWYFLGKCYERLGAKTAALQVYKTLVDGFPSAPETVEAKKLIKVLAVNRAPMSGALKQAPKPVEKTDLINRIYVVPPKFNHSSVSPSTVQIVTEVIRNLPPNVYKILNEGDVNIYVLPNLTDKYPEAVSDLHPITKLYLSQEDGRTYDTVVNIYERRAVRGGSTELAAPNSPAVIKSTLYILLAHALNACLEFPSRGEQYRRVYQQDVSAMNIAMREKLYFFTAEEQHGTGETFANLSASIMGRVETQDKDLNRGFPRCRAWIENRIESVVHKGGKH